ncbi:MAG: hypothetical protein ACR2P1_03555 [Pseudomonadales bacterium]
MKRVAKWALLLVLVVVVALAIKLTKPWDDLQSWRQFTMMVEWTRADLFTHWEVMQPVSKLKSSSNPRIYQRDTVDPATISYQFEGESYPLTHYFEKANISGFMVLIDGEVRLEYYAKDFNAESRNHIWLDLWQAGADFDAWAGVLGRRVPAGTDFNYIATDTHVLAAVLRGAYGKPFVDMMQEKLWESGGFGAAQWGLDHHGHAMGHCCLSVRLQDFANLGQLYLEDLVINGEAKVNDDWIGMVENAQAPFQEPRYHQQDEEEAKLLEGHSFQFWLLLDYDQEFIAKGAFGQYLWTDRKNKFVVAQFSTGQSMISFQGQAPIKPEEFAAVARAMNGLATGEV